MISERIKEQRKKMRYTQKQLADKVNVSPQVISNWERGYTEPSADDINKLAEKLDCTSDYLLGREGSAHRYIGMMEIIEEAKSHLDLKLRKETKLTKYEKDLHLRLINHDGVPTVNIDLFLEARDYLDAEKKQDKDIAKRLQIFKDELENSDGLAFDGEPMSEEAKESLLESMELLFRQTQRINKKYTPKKYREDE